MSSSNSQTSVSGSEVETEAGGTGSLMLVPEQERSLAQRMMLYVYNRSGIVTARQLAFWEVFRERNPDVELPARDLRAMFFGEVLYEPEHFEDLDFAVEQYLNPRFNQIQLEALEFGDLAEGEDFLLNVPRNATEGGMSFEQLANYISTPLEAARNVQLAPLNVQMVMAPRPPSPPKPSSGEDDELREKFGRLLCELLYSNEEAIEKPVLEVQEIRERVLAVTTAGIKLEDLLEPDMECYKLLKPPKMQESPAADQMVPVAVAVGSSSSKSAQKRWKSWDDSGLGLTPTKRRRLMTPGSVTTRQHARLRRILSAPHNT